VTGISILEGLKRRSVFAIKKEDFCCQRKKSFSQNAVSLSFFFLSKDFGMFNVYFCCNTEIYLLLHI